MTQEDKLLLLQDLCARLPYYPKCEMIDEIRVVNNEKDSSYISTLFPKHIELFSYHNNFTIKPYLRPLSSMTEEEKRELSAKYNWSIRGNDISIRYHSEGYWDDDTECPTNEYLKLFDWLNAHHFDYRDLIKKGLAIEAPEVNKPCELPTN